MRVVGLDTSLTGTGLAVVEWLAPALGTDPKVEAGTLHPPKGLRDVARLRWLLGAVVGALTDIQPDLVVMEAPSYGSTGGSAHERAGWWWAAACACETVAPVALVAPSQLKKYATGKGNAGDKDAMMLATARRFGSFDGDNNAADALWLAAFGAQLLGHPVVDLPVKNLEAVESFHKGKRPWLSDKRPIKIQSESDQQGAA